MKYHMIHSRSIYSQSAMCSVKYFAMYARCYSADRVPDRLFKYSSCQFFTAIIESMMRSNPGDRPSAVEALQRWRSVQNSVQRLHWLWRSREREETYLWAIIYDTTYVFLVYHVRRTISLLR